MLTRLRNARSIAIGLVASLAMVAGAHALGSMFCLRIIAPAGVPAGNPILGYVTGGASPMSVYSASPLMPISPPTTGYSDPLFFAIPTLEPMAGTVVTITANDAIGNFDIHLTFVW